MHPLVCVLGSQWGREDIEFPANYMTKETLWGHLCTWARALRKAGPAISGDRESRWNSQMSRRCSARLAQRRCRQKGVGGRLPPKAGSLVHCFVFFLPDGEIFPSL